MNGSRKKNAKRYLQLQWEEVIKVSVLFLSCCALRKMDLPFVGGKGGFSGKREQECTKARSRVYRLKQIATFWALNVDRGGCFEKLMFFLFVIWWAR